MNRQPEISKEMVLGFYRKLMTIRRFEEKADQLYQHGKIPCPIHLSVGQEAVAVGVAEALNEGDLVMPSHRGHGFFLARGTDPGRLMAELCGKANGICKGRGGSIHLADVERGLLGSNGVVGAGLSIATGVGLAVKMQGTGQICICSFGDGASNGGHFHEALNLAALWRLPIVFVCENNRYAVSVSVEKSTAVADIAVRSVAYGIPGEVVDGMDVVAVYQATKSAVGRARSGDGPTLLECKCYRYMGHSRGDPPYGPYRSKEELERWRQRDPRQRLVEQGGLTKAETDAIDGEIATSIEDAVRYAEESPFPDVNTTLNYVYG
jgi:TPP-dependent pyruvate/acetoin dehydrogenase alpha subunit